MTPAAAKQRWLEMGAEERLAMAKECPPWAGPWSDTGDDFEVRELSDGGEASVCGYPTGVIWNIDEERPRKIEYGTLREAMTACDAELIRQGYVLENEP